MFDPASRPAPGSFPDQTTMRENGAGLLPRQAQLNIRGKTLQRHGALVPRQSHQIEAFIAENIAKPIRVRDLARCLCLSNSYFHLIFRGSTGETPHAYVMRRKIEHAQRLMTRTDLPLSQIALECGLADQPHLTNLFRRQTGTSPASWRKKYGSAPSIPPVLKSVFAKSKGRVTQINQGSDA